jgi:hypothetical protein
MGLQTHKTESTAKFSKVVLSDFTVAAFAATERNAATVYLLSNLPLARRSRRSSLFADQWLATL